MEFTDALVMGKPLWMWVIFMTVVVVLLALDLGLFHRKAREIGVKESLLLSAFYITIGLAFGAWVWVNIGPASGKEYLTGFLVEKTLSMDNIFIMSVIFSYFGIPRIYQHRVFAATLQRPRPQRHQQRGLGLGQLGDINLVHR